MTTTPTRRHHVGLDLHGLDPAGGRRLEPVDLAALHATRSGAATGARRTVARSSSTRARSPAARRRTSSSSPSPAPRTGSGGARSTIRSPRRGSTAAREGRRASRMRRIRSTSSMPSPAPIAAHRIGGARGHRQPVPRALREDDVHRRRRPRSAQSLVPDVVVLHAPAVEADPEQDGTRVGHVRRPPPDAAAR